MYWLDYKQKPQQTTALAGAYQGTNLRSLRGLARHLLLCGCMQLE